LRARGQLQRGEFAGARGRLEAARARWPQAQPPLVLLSHALLRQGRDPAGAEAVLCEMLARAPGDAEVRHNLEVLVQERRRGRRSAGPVTAALFIAWSPRTGTSPSS
jgi:hypothetical protein